jgi:O-antigen ligase
VSGGYYFAPIPQGWVARIETIKTPEEVEERSAVSRLHFWRVAVDMVKDRPLGVGLKNFEAAYDRYDTSHGSYGTGRSVHSSHFQVLAELGILGTAVYVFMFCCAFVTAFRIRRRARHPRLSLDDSKFLLSMANALVASMAGYLVGGAFLSEALNDVTWLTFALVAALDKISARLYAEARDVPAERPATARGLQNSRPQLQPAFSFSPRR